MRVSDKREQFIKSLLGSNADEEMRLARISRENLKKAPEQAIDLCKAQGFFPGERALVIEEANETISDIIIQAVEAWKDGDATIVVTAGLLKPSSSMPQQLSHACSLHCLRMRLNMRSSQSVHTSYSTLLILK